MFIHDQILPPEAIVKVEFWGVMWREWLRVVHPRDARFIDSYNAFVYSFLAS